MAKSNMLQFNRRALLAGAITWGSAAFLGAKTTQNTGHLPVYNLRTAKIPTTRLACMTSKDVSDAVAGLKMQGSEFSVLSSGHCFAGFSQNTDTVIDLSNMNRMSVKDDVLIAEPGATLGDVQRQAALSGRCLPAGLCQTVALGGHIAAGGVGFLSRRHGLACDHLIEAEVMLADGSIVLANEAENPDLFWALRGGGGGSFGIVTKMRFRTVPNYQSQFVRAFWNLPQGQAAQFVVDWQNWSLSLPNHLSTTLNISTSDQQKVFMKLELVSTHQKASMIRAMENLAQIWPLAHPPELYEGNFAALADPIWPRGWMGEGHYDFGSDVMENVMSVETLNSAVNAIMASGPPKLGIFIERLGGKIAEETPAATAFYHRKAAFKVQYYSVFNTGHDDEIQAQKFQHFKRLFKKNSDGHAYVGYPDQSLPDWPQQYWGDNYERLQQIKRKYDPQNLFRHAQSVRP